MAKMPQLHFYKVKEVIKIVDGDTVDLLIDLGFETYRKTRVRMSGINAWESRTKNLKEKELGLAAKDRLRELCEQAMEKESLKILSTKKEKYGRYLGVLYGNGKNINDLLVSEGHAHLYDGGKRKKYG